MNTFTTYRFRTKTRFNDQIEYSNGELLCNYLNHDLTKLQELYLLMLDIAQRLGYDAPSEEAAGGLSPGDVSYDLRRVMEYVDGLVLSNPPYDLLQGGPQPDGASSDRSALTGLRFPAGDECGLRRLVSKEAAGHMEEIFSYYLPLSESILRVSNIYARYIESYFYRDGVPHSAHDTVHTYNDFLTDNRERTGERYRFQTEAPVSITMSHKVLQEQKDNTVKLRLWEAIEYRHIGDYLASEFSDILRARLFVKKCACCGRFFIINSRYNTDYCDNIAPGETNRTCREIGAQRTFREKVSSDPVWLAYQRAYKTHYARMTKKKISKSEFLAWANEALELRSKALNREISFEEYLQQIKK